VEILIMKNIVKGCFLIAGLGVLAIPASGHVVLAETGATAGSYHAAFFRISHACGSSPTIRLRVEIPDSIVSVAPQPKPGWTLNVERDGDKVKALIWEGRLEANHFDQFGAMFRLPATNGVLYFPTIQTCATGENRWVQIPPPGKPWNSVEFPAPVLQLTGGEDHAHH